MYYIVRLKKEKKHKKYDIIVILGGYSVQPQYDEYCKYANKFYRLLY